jgi:hypothetical protein
MAADAVFAQNAWEHVQIFLTGSTALAFVAHMVQTIPTPKSEWAQWLLGGIQWLVGQRIRATNTLQGDGTLTQPVDRTLQNPPAKIDAPPIPSKDSKSE